MLNKFKERKKERQLWGYFLLKIKIEQKRKLDSFLSFKSKTFKD